MGTGGHNGLTLWALDNVVARTLQINPKFKISALLTFICFPLLSASPVKILTANHSSGSRGMELCMNSRVAMSPSVHPMRRILGPTKFGDGEAMGKKLHCFRKNNDQSIRKHRLSVIMSVMTTDVGSEVKVHLFHYCFSPCLILLPILHLRYICSHKTGKFYCKIHLIIGTDFENPLFIANGMPG